MKKSLFFVSLMLFLTSCATNYLYRDNAANAISTASSTSGSNSNYGITLEKVELINKYTVLHISYNNNLKVERDNQGRIIKDGTSQIRIKPTATLLALEGQRKFSFIDARGIPIDPHYMVSKAGEKTNFTLYFERLDPGLEVFDLFECNDFDYITCWNIKGIKVSNPIVKLP